jgi:glycosyltransferase involved in cell wall biosynthesis
MVVMEASAHATPSVVVAGEDNAAVELVQDGANGFVAAGDDPETIAAAIVRVHEAGLALRERTARWFEENVERQSLEHSLRTVLKRYADEEAAEAASTSAASTSTGT